jgi:hypothetical protein
MGLEASVRPLVGEDFMPSGRTRVAILSAVRMKCKEVLTNRRGTAPERIRPFRKGEVHRSRGGRGVSLAGIVVPKLASWVGREIK